MLHRDDFYDWDGARQEVTLWGRRYRLPAFYHDNDVFTSLHTASYEKVAAALPSDMLRLVRWTDGRALLSVTAFRYHAVTSSGPDVQSMAPYGEVSVAAVVTMGPAPRVTPLLQSRVSGFVLHLPVTTREARDAGVIVYGFPKFVADMHFDEEPGCRQVEVSEGEDTILTLTVRPAGPVLTDKRPLVAYTALHGELLETVIPVRGRMQIRFGRAAGELRLGNHEVGRQLRGLDIAPTPLCVFSYLEHRSILPPGRVAGPARDYLGYLGTERDFGQFTVSYPHAMRLDQYAPVSSPGAAHLPVS